MNRIKLPFLALFSLFTCLNLNATSKPDLELNSRGMNIEVTFYSPKIVRVLKYPAGQKPDIESLVVIKTPENTDVRIDQKGDLKVLSSEYLNVSVDPAKGYVSFSKPDGKKLLEESVTSFTPVAFDSVKTYNVRTSFLLDENEPIYGVGQVMDGKFNRRNSKHHLQNENMFTYSPYFISPSKGYAVYSDNYSIQDFTDNNQVLEFSQLGDASDYYFLAGDNSDDIIAGVRDLSGHSPLLPLWALGYFQSKERYETQQEVVDVLSEYRKRGIPIDVMIQDWRYWPEYNGTDSLWNAQKFDATRYPDPQKWVKDIHDMNGKLLIVTWPGFGPKTPQYQHLDSLGHLLPLYTWPPESGAHPYDVFSDEARDIYWDNLNKGIFSYIGNDGWWLDSTEPDHIEVKESDFNAMTDKGLYRMVKNAYSLMHNKGISEHQRAQNKDKRIVLLTRSGHIGQQRYGSNTWSGDVVSRWDVLANQIPAALNYTIMGIPNWNSDIGGFFAWDWVTEDNKMKDEYKDLYVRWAQFGAFTPMMRSHGTVLPREIWRFGEVGEPHYEAIADAIRLRYKLLPYNYSLAADVAFNDGTFMRPLFMDFPDDSEVYSIGNQYLWGKNIMIAPVTEPEKSTWTVYLPGGASWWDYEINSLYDGGQAVEKSINLNTIPLFIKAGSIIPFGPDVQYSNEKKWDNLEIRIYPGENGSFTLYEDEFDNHNYEQGLFSTIDFDWNDAENSLMISNRNGKYPGMLSKRNFNIKLMNKENGEPREKTVKYNGKQTTVKF